MLTRATQSCQTEYRMYTFLSVRRFTRRTRLHQFVGQLTRRPIRKFAIFTRQPTENLPGIIISILHTTGVQRQAGRQTGQGLTRDQESKRGRRGGREIYSERGRKEGRKEGRGICWRRCHLSLLQTLFADIIYCAAFASRPRRACRGVSPAAPATPVPANTAFR